MHFWSRQGTDAKSVKRVKTVLKKRPENMDNAAAKIFAADSTYLNG